MRLKEVRHGRDESCGPDERLARERPFEEPSRAFNRVIAIHRLTLYVDRNCGLSATLPRSKQSLGNLLPVSLDAQPWKIPGVVQAILEV